MRRGYDNKFLIDEENNELLGIDLGSDHCAEHEWGINTIKNKFALNDKENIFGVAKRIINKVPENLIFKELKVKNKKCFVLILLSDYLYLNDINESNHKDWLPSELIPYKEDKLICAWDSKTFGILVTKEYEKEIKTIYEAFKNKDIALGLASPKPFSNGSLVLTIVSKLSNETKDEIYKDDEDYYNLQRTSNTKL